MIPTAALSLLAVTTSAAPGPNAPPPPTEFAVILGGARAGTMTVQATRASAYRVTFEYNDRGRGPRLDSTIRLGPDSTPVRIETDGNDYLKGPVAERFERTATRAKWSSSGGAGSRAVSGRAFYLPFDGTPFDTGLLARALQRAPGRTIALLPEGEATLEKTGELQLDAGKEHRKVVQYAITGLDFMPVRVWLDPEGGFFASASHWLTVVPTGWQDAVPRLLAAQDAAEAARSAALAKSLAHRPAKALVFTGAALFDADDAVSRPGQTVVIEGDRIATVGPDGKVPVPAGAEVVPLNGKTLLPGLWDMHVHLAAGDGLLDIANGVTTARDMGNDMDTLLAMKKSFDDGGAIGPRARSIGIALPPWSAVWRCAVNPMWPRAIFGVPCWAASTAS
jgi:hypothetical protein